MMELLREWYRRHFSDPQVVILALLLLSGLLAVVYMGPLLAPVLAGLVIAYVLDGMVAKLMKLRVPRLVAVLLVFSLFMAFLLTVLFVLVPLLSQQLVEFVRALPQMLAQGQQQLLRLPELYPGFISQESVNEMLAVIRGEIAGAGQQVLSWSLASVVGAMTFLVYLVLVPLMVFFFLKDRDAIVRWAAGFLPSERGLATQVWHEVNEKVANYVRGKFLEILLVWLVSYVTFSIMGLNYAMLLSTLVGVSVIIPYVGAIVVTFPVALVAYFQWGASSEFSYVLLAYMVIQFLDGNLLVPLLFSEVVSLHPVAIIVAVLFFGGLWGVWGVFFAIPLATVVQAVINAWPRESRPA